MPVICFHRTRVSTDEYNPTDIGVCVMGKKQNEYILYPDANNIY